MEHTIVLPMPLVYRYNCRLQQIIIKLLYKSTKTSGYFCECPNGRIGNGFKTEFGGDGCSDTCELFTLDCSNDHYVIEFNPGMIFEYLMTIELWVTIMRERYSKYLKRLSNRILFVFEME